MNGRINSLIAALNIKKVDFAKRLSISQSFVSDMCSGRGKPSERTITDICHEFNVNETWLRTGEGEMFVKESRSDEIAKFVGRIMAGEEDNFRRRFVAMLARLNESEWEFIERKALELFDEAEKD